MFTMNWAKRPAPSSGEHQSENTDYNTVVIQNNRKQQQTMRTKFFVLDIMYYEALHICMYLAKKRVEVEKIWSLFHFEYKFKETGV